MNTSFWSGKKVLVTGHTGFKGSWLCLWLQHLGATVTGFALNPSSNPNFYELTSINRCMSNNIGDIRDYKCILNLILQYEPEVVIHMAAQSLVRYSYIHPVETYSTNIMGTINLLEAVRQTSSVRAVVNVTSDKCYENKEWIWGYRENEALGGNDPYSSSKGCAELVTSSYRNSFFNPSNYSLHKVALATARAGNVIGGGDWSDDRLIPDTIRALSIGQRVAIRNPNAIRPWQHVLEPLSGYLNLAEKLYTQGPKFSEAFNFGPVEDDARPVSWIVNELTKCWGGGASWILDTTENPHEAQHLKLDCSKAKNLLEWQGRWSLEKSLENIVFWHKAHLRGANMREISLAQIESFTNT